MNLYNKLQNILQDSPTPLLLNNNKIIEKSYDYIIEIQNKKEIGVQFNRKCHPNTILWLIMKLINLDDDIDVTVKDCFYISNEKILYNEEMEETYEKDMFLYYSKLISDIDESTYIFEHTPNESISNC